MIFIFNLRHQILRRFYDLESGDLEISGEDYCACVYCFVRCRNIRYRYFTRSGFARQSLQQVLLITDLQYKIHIILPGSDSKIDTPGPQRGVAVKLHRSHCLVAADFDRRRCQDACSSVSIHLVISNLCLQTTGVVITRKGGYQYIGQSDPYTVLSAVIRSRT